MLSGMILQIVAEVWGQPICPIVKCQTVQGKGLHELFDPRR